MKRIDVVFTPPHRRNFCLEAKPAIPASRLLLVVEPPFRSFKFYVRQADTKKPAFQQVFFYLVGTRGFEPPTSCTPCKRSTRLNYVPILQYSFRNQPMQAPTRRGRFRQAELRPDYVFHTTNYYIERFKNKSKCFFIWVAY